MSLLLKLQVGKNESFFTVQWFFKKKKKSQEIVETHFEQFQFDTADFFSEQRFGYCGLFCSRLDLI